MQGRITNGFNLMSQAFLYMKSAEQELHLVKTFVEGLHRPGVDEGQGQDQGQLHVQIQGEENQDQGQGQGHGQGQDLNQEEEEEVQFLVPDIPPENVQVHVHPDQILDESGENENSRSTESSGTTNNQQQQQQVIFLIN